MKKKDVAKNINQDKKRLLREETHLTRPPRLEGVVKNAKMNPKKKPKKEHVEGEE